MQKRIVFIIGILINFQYVFAFLEKEFMQALSSPTKWSKHKEKLNKALNCQIIDVNKLKFKGKTFYGFDFSGMNFQGIKFKKCKFQNVNLEEANLTNTYFVDTSFEEVRLGGAILAEYFIFDERRSSPLELVKWYAELKNERDNNFKLNLEAQLAFQHVFLEDRESFKLVKKIGDLIEKQRELDKKYLALHRILGLFKLDLEGKDLSGLNLTSIELKNANLNGANLQGANLNYANLSHAFLESANLQKTNLSYAYLKKADLTNTNLKEANLSGAKLWGVRLSENLVLSNSASKVFKQFKESEGEERAIFQKLISAKYKIFDRVPNCLIKDLNWKDINFSYADLSEAQLEGMDLEGINLEGSNLLWTNLKSTLLKNANLKNTNLYATNFEKSNLTRAQLTNTRLFYVKFKESNLTDVDLTEIKLDNHVDFSKAWLSKDYMLPEMCSTQILEKLWHECQNEKIKPILKHLASNIKIDNEYFTDCIVTEESLEVVKKLTVDFNNKGKQRIKE